jgi:hypothetical protein
VPAPEHEPVRERHADGSSADQLLAVLVAAQARHKRRLERIRAEMAVLGTEWLLV